MRYLKSVHLPNERHHQEEERHYNRKEFEEIMNRLTASVQLPSEHNPELVKAMHVGSEKSEAKIREGYLKAIGDIDTMIQSRRFNTDRKQPQRILSNYVFERIRPRSA